MNVRRLLFRGLFVTGLVSSLWAAPALPIRISDSQYRMLMAALSEPGGAFQSDNLTSNEMGLQAVLPALHKELKSGAAYIGVGPEQNFTYIAAIQPRIAFIIDIRRGNTLLQLMYKALFELSPTRADFAARLFCRPQPSDLTERSTADELMAAYMKEPGRDDLFQRNWSDLQSLLVEKHELAVSLADQNEIERIYRTFRTFGPEISQGVDTAATSAAAGKVPGLPTYKDLMTAKDTEGREQSFLASEDRYRIVRGLEMSNRVVPVTGDFGGPKTIRAIGQYLKQHSVNVSAFYCSNVEEYLFGGYGNVNGGWQRFYANVAALPLDNSSAFIRSAGAYHARDEIGGSGAQILARVFSTPNVISSIRDILEAVKTGQIHNFGDVLALSH